MIMPSVLLGLLLFIVSWWITTELLMATSRRKAHETTNVDDESDGYQLSSQEQEEWSKLAEQERSNIAEDNARDA